MVFVDKDSKTECGYLNIGEQREPSTGGVLFLGVLRTSRKIGADFFFAGWRCTA